MRIGEILQLIAGILIVILAAYYVTYFVANRKIKRAPGRGISVGERFSLSKDKMVCVIESRGVAYLVVITNGGATVLDSYDIEELEAAGPVRPDGARARQGYVPSGIIARGIWKLFNSFRGATFAKTETERRAERPVSDEATKTEKPVGDTGRGKSDFTVRTAREEDGIDEIQRRLKNRMAASPDPEEAPRNE